MRFNLAEFLRVIRADLRLAFKYALLHFQRIDPSQNIFQARRCRILSQRKPRARRVQHAHRLVRQLPPGNIPMRQPHGRRNRLIENAQVVMLLERRLDAAQHRARNLFGRLLHLHHLEPSRQCRVLLKILLVLRPRGRGDGAQLTARQRRLQKIGRIALSRLPPRADHGVRFIDEEDDLSSRRLHLVDQSLQPVFKLAFNSRARLQEGQVETVDLNPLQGRRHIAADQAIGKPLHHGRLSNARLTGENRIVLPPPHQDVDHLPHFNIAAQNRIDLPGLGVGSQVHRVLVQVRRLAF